MHCIHCNFVQWHTEHIINVVSTNHRLCIVSYVSRLYGHPIGSANLVSLGLLSVKIWQNVVEIVLILQTLQSSFLFFEIFLFSFFSVFEVMVKGFFQWYLFVPRLLSCQLGKNIWGVSKEGTLVLMFSAACLFSLLPLVCFAVESLSRRKPPRSHRQQAAEKQARKCKNK